MVLDLDAPDDPIHRGQEVRFSHGYYEGYCYSPSYIFCGDSLSRAKLRTSGVDANEGSKEEIERIMKQWPEVKIVVQGDAGFAREEIMRWCEGNKEVVVCLSSAYPYKEIFQFAFQNIRKAYLMLCWGSEKISPW